MNTENVRLSFSIYIHIPVYSFCLEVGDRESLFFFFCVFSLLLSVAIEFKDPLYVILHSIYFHSITDEMTMANENSTSNLCRRTQEEGEQAQKKRMLQQKHVRHLYYILKNERTKNDNLNFCFCHPNGT